MPLENDANQVEVKIGEPKVLGLSKISLVNIFYTDQLSWDRAEGSDGLPLHATKHPKIKIQQKKGQELNWVTVLENPNIAALAA